MLGIWVKSSWVWLEVLVGEERGEVDRGFIYIYFLYFFYRLGEFYFFFRVCGLDFIFLVIIIDLGKGSWFKLV